MNKQNYIDDLTAYLREQTGRAEIPPEAMILDSGLIDSFGIVLLVGFIEEKYGIQLSGEEMTAETLASVSSIADLLVRRAGQPAAEGRP